ncbi:hypothetical protein ZIOFF_069405 [Zingiber officinale]|uniref:Uncharacterized protein n=2 Tax=Zingiber officinale TaxID=94328 RepID=A0A8J5ECP4_ZINOF|nr:hypothetical protein ZIOFF_069405 [Zingiber officinale]
MDFDWFSSGKGFDCSSWRCFDLLLLFVDKSVHMFDQRNLTSGGVGAPVHKLDGHKWFLDKASIFRRAAEDGFLNIWDYEDLMSLMSSNGFIKASYNLTRFAITVNELTLGLKEKLPPTDSRLRPDQRCLENGEYEMANAEKLRLEQRQRQARKMQESGWKPQWFVKDKGSETYRYIGGYWEAREDSRFSWLTRNCTTRVSPKSSNQN